MTYSTDDGVGLVYRGTELVEAVAEVDGKGAFVVNPTPTASTGSARTAPRAASAPVLTSPQ